MRVPLSWLKEFVDVTITSDALAQRLTYAGLEVAEVERIGVAGADLPWEPDKIVIGAILEVRQHPNADRLVVADVDYGADEPHMVVTGAPNLFPFKGRGPLQPPLKAVYAMEGVTLYDGHADGQVKMVLKGRPVRGIMSDAMLCSEKEIGLSDDHEGILLLPEDAPVGTPLCDYLGDEVLTIDLTPNLARALSIVGVAREVAALTGAPLRIPEFPLDADGPTIAGQAQVTIETPDLCPRFTLTLIEGVTIKPSPFWMQRRLILAGMRPINAVVDVSNYVMLELGQPSHAFDADMVAEQHLIVRLARPGERLTTLDGKEHDLAPERLLVCDPRGPLGVAGVMGGLASEVSEKTTRVLLEGAIWEPTTIRKTAQALRLPSEASRRFERGVDYDLPPLMQRRALGLLRQIAGGRVMSGMIDIYSRPWKTLTLDLPPSEVQRIIGISLSAETIAKLLQSLGFHCTLHTVDLTEVVHVVVPSYRQDVTILADLCEEIARIYGYDRIPSTMLADELQPQRANPSLELEQRARDLLVGCGLDEAITYSLTSMASIAKVNPADAEPANYLRLTNPITPDREYMRRSLLPTLLEALALNMRERDRTLLFEIGRVYLPSADLPRPDEPRRAALAIAGRRDSYSWLAQANEQLDFFDLKGIIETFLTRLNLRDRIAFVPLTDDPRFHPGRAAVLRWADQPTEPHQLGVLGELHPDVIERLEIAAPRPLAAELDIETLIAHVQTPRYRPISRFPASIQDIALVVDKSIPIDRIITAIRKYAGATLESLLLFDVYEGPQVEPHMRSLAYRLTFRALDRTLSDADVSKIRVKIIKGLERDIAAVIRS